MVNQTPNDPETTNAPEEQSQVAELAQMIERLAIERDDAIAAKMRAQADFANFQRRSIENEERARIRGLSQITRALMPVLDHFDLALAQDASKLTVEQLSKSIEMTRAELQKALEQNGIARIEPAPARRSIRCSTMRSCANRPRASRRVV